VQAREFTGAIGLPKGDAGSQRNHKEARGATVVNMKREVAVVPVFDVDRVEVLSRVLGWPLDIDSGRLVSQG